MTSVASFHTAQCHKQQTNETTSRSYCTYSTT